MSTASKKRSTARKGNPGQASRGAAVQRAKVALGDAIDRRLNLDVEAMELALLAGVLGVTAGAVRARLAGATLAELQDWTRLISEPEPIKAVA